MNIDERKLVDLITSKVLKELHLRRVEPIVEKSLRKPLIVIPEVLPAAQEIDRLLKDLADLPGDFQLLLENPNFQSELTGILRERTIKDISYLDKLGNIKESALETVLNQSSILVLPWISVAALARLISLQPECLTSLLLAKGLMENKQIWLRKIFLRPLINLYQFATPSPFVRRVQSLVREGKLLGLQWFEKDDLEAFCQRLVQPVQRGFEGLLTVKDIQRMAEQKEICLSRETVITPLARDELKRQKIKVVWTDVREVK